MMASWLDAGFLVCMLLVGLRLGVMIQNARHLVWARWRTSWD